MVHAPNAFTIVKETENRGIDELKKKKKIRKVFWLDLWFHFKTSLNSTDTILLFKVIRNSHYILKRFFKRTACLSGKPSPVARCPLQKLQFQFKMLSLSSCLLHAVAEVTEERMWAEPFMQSACWLSAQPVTQADNH